MGTFEKIKQISPWFFGVFAVLLVLFFTIGDQTVVDAVRQRMSNETNALGMVGDISIDRLSYDKQVQQITENQRAQGQDDIKQSQVSNQVWGYEVNKALYAKEFEINGISVHEENIVDIMLTEPPRGLQRYFSDGSGQFNQAMYVQLLNDLDGSALSFIQQSLRERPDFQAAYKENPEGAEQWLAENAQTQATEMIENYRQIFLSYEDSLRSAIPYAAYSELVSEAGSVVSPTYAKAQYKIDRTAADIVYIPFSANSYDRNEIKITDKEIQDYYNKHKDEYVIDEDRVKMDFIVIPFHPLRSDSVKNSKYIESVAKLLNEADSSAKEDAFASCMTKYFGTEHDGSTNTMNRQKAEVLKNLEVGKISNPVVVGDTTYFFRVDKIGLAADTTIQARHILLRFNTPEEKDSIQKLANSLIEQLKGKADFAALATQYSSDQGSAIKGGDLGFFGRGAMVPVFEKACFAQFSKKGLVPTPIESQYGFHIIDVTDTKVDIPDTNARKVRYAQIPFTPEVGDMSMSSFKRVARDVTKRMKGDETIDSIAKDLKLIPGTSGYIGRDNALTITQPEWITNKFFTDTAFVAEKGTVLRARTFDKCIVVVKVADKQEKGEFKSLEEMSPACKNEVLKEKQMNLAKADVEKAFANVKNYGNLTAALAADSTLGIMQMQNFRSTSNAPQVNRDPLFNAKIMMDGSHGMEIVKGESGYYILEVTNFNCPTEQQITDDYKSYMPTLANAAKSQMFNGWYMALRKNTEIKDNRYKYYTDY